MTLVWTGALLFGLMWGWLSPTRTSAAKRPLINFLAAAGAGLLLGGSIYWKVDQKAAVVFLAGAVLAYCVKLGWRQALRRRFEP